MLLDNASQTPPKTRSLVLEPHRIIVFNSWNNTPHELEKDYQISKESADANPWRGNTDQLGQRLLVQIALQ